MATRLLNYRKDWFRFDAVAGLTTAAVVIPKAMAFATIAGLPVQAGIYVAIVPMFVYALLGTSRRLSVSSTSTLAILTATELAVAVPTGDPGQLLAAASTLALLVGGILLLAGILRLGFLANFISDPVLTGFKAGIGLVIVVDQLPKLLGVHIEKGNFFHDLFSTLKHLPQSNHATVILAAAMLALLFLMERFFPKTPAPLVAVVLGVAAVPLFGLGSHGIALTGHIPSGFPTPAVPDFSLALKLWPGALGMALMSFTESIAAGRAFAAHDDPLPSPNRELTRARCRQRRRKFLPMLSRRRRNLPNRRQHTSRSPHPGSRASHRSHRRCHRPLPLTPDQLAPPGHPGRRRCRHHASAARHGRAFAPSSPSGVPSSSGPWQPAPASYSSWNPPWHPRRGRHLPPHAPLPGQPSPRLRRNAQAPHRRLPPPVPESSRRRNPSRPLDRAHRRPHDLRQRPLGPPTHSGLSPAGAPAGSHPRMQRHPRTSSTPRCKSSSRPNKTSAKPASRYG